ncbi:unnamed protein product [Caenorhabditis angaria]|uniref:Serpentine Receptor, class AB (Class A-like) n=1 Tax=Caenorhabditis angaria TaxID=860376 RepID=A0A9P1N810_9PELO|nr:unnamed protein product [Caenorhabditis angaria]
MPANCTIMADIGHSYILKFSLSINLLIAIIAIPVLATAGLYLRKKQLFHVNTRLQIQLQILALIMHCVGRLGLHIFDLINYFSDFKDGCEILPDFYRCLYARGLYNVGMTITQMCSIALVFERSVALLYSKNYENFSSLFGFFLAFFQLVLSFCFLFNLYKYAPFEPSQTVVLYYCQTLASGTGSVWTINAPLYAVMIAQVLCRVIFEILDSINFKMRQAHQNQTLSTRYNLEQGQRSITTLKIFVNVNTFFYAFLSIVGTSLHFNAASFTKAHYFAIVEMIHFLPTYGILLSIYIYWTLRKLDKSLKSSLTKSIKTNPNMYFEQFNMQVL